VSEKLTYCVRKGSRLWRPGRGHEWTVAYAASPKALCGRLVRVTSVKAGDVRNAQPIAVLRVRGANVGAHPKNLKLVGRGS